LRMCTMVGIKLGWTTCEAAGVPNKTRNVSVSFALGVSGDPRPRRPINRPIKLTGPQRRGPPPKGSYR